jgi:hypothetical protein
VQQIRTELENQYSDTIAKQQSSIEKLSALVGGAYEKVHQPAAADPEVTEQDLVKDPIGTLNRVSDARTKKALEEYNKGMSQVLNTVVERGYQGELRGLTGQRFYKYAEPEIKKMFDANPQLKLQPNAVDYAYKMLVGENYEAWEKQLATETTEPGGGPKPPVVPAPTPTPAPQRGGGGPPRETDAKVEPELTQNQKILQAKLNNMGFDMSASDMEGA